MLKPYLGLQNGDSFPPRIAILTSLTAKNIFFMTISSITPAFRCSPRRVKATWHRSNPNLNLNPNPSRKFSSSSKNSAPTPGRQP